MSVIARRSNILKTPSTYNASFSQLAFVPKCDPVKSEDVQFLKEFLENCGRLCALTGAGISTESGIPDYRSEQVGLYATSDRRPMQYKEFCSGENARKRYWARNFVAWPRFSRFEPNVTHAILRDLEIIGKMRCVITQNVDSLHKKAGSKNVIELHGTAFIVICLDCDRKISRFALQEELVKLNPTMIQSSDKIRPDGDVDLSQEQIENFNLPACKNCGGRLKPDIVFFGDNVSRDVSLKIDEEVGNADSLLILGTSLTTYSGYRIVLQAVEAKKPIVIVNIGPTRADELVSLKVQGRCGEIFSKIYSKNT